MEVGRKRLRTETEDKNRQQKYLITSRIVEQNDKMMMQKVYGNKFISQFTEFRDLIQLNTHRKDTKHAVFRVSSTKTP